MGLKRCFKCLRDLPIECFYRHKQMADGRLSKCGDCTRADVKLHRAQNVERVRAYDRARSKRPESIAVRTATTAAWRKQYPERARAQTTAARAGLDAPALCEGCNLDRKLEKHHPDYSKPVVVVWLCKPCHAIADKIRRKTEVA